MTERGQNLAFPLEAGHALGVTGERFRQNLDRYITA